MRRIILISFLLIFINCDFSNKPEKLTRTKAHLKIFGSWKVVNSSYLYFDHISYCEKLGINSIFTFNEFGEVKVFKNSKALKNCNEKQFFWIENEDLFFFEFDFVFKYKILKFTNDSLVLKSNHFPEFLEGKVSLQDYVNGKRDSINERIKREGITITLKKTI